MSISHPAQTPAAAESARAEAEAITGPAVAFTLAAGIGVFTMGIVTTLSEASTSVADALNWDNGVGALSGKSIIAAAVFFASLAGLGFAWRHSNPPLRSILIAAAILAGFGILGTFPIFFQAFA